MDEIRSRIYSMSDEKYKEFQKKLLPDIKNYVGVRLPLLRKLAKEISKNNVARNDYRIYESGYIRYFFLRR